jgi:hypothetical protein
VYGGSGKIEGVIQDAQCKIPGPGGMKGGIFFQELIHGISQKFKVPL